MKDKDLKLMQLMAMAGFSKMLFNKSYLYNNNKHLKENFYMQYHWLKELIDMIENKQIFFKKNS